MPGTQLSLFDMDFTSNVFLDKKEPSLDSNKPAMAKDITIQSFKPKIEKVKKPMEITAAQQKFLDQNEVMKGENLETLSRIIICSCGWMAIEGICKELNVCSTTYINAEGQTEFILEKKSSVLPADRIIYHKTDFEINEIQQQKLQEVKERYQNKINRIIHRHGDENILVEVEGKLLDIISNGWVLEFTETTHVECAKDEVLEDFQEKQDVGQLVQPGDLVQATIGKGLVEGTITNEYGIACEILNISFERNGTMFSTAIPRAHVKAVLGKAKCIFWKYDDELGIAYFCPKCKKFLCSNDKKCECGQEIDWSNKVHFEKCKIKWSYEPVQKQF